MSEVLQESLSGGAGGFFVLPFGCRQCIGLAGRSVGGRRGGEQHGVGGDSQGGDVLNGFGFSNLGLSNAKDCFFVPEVHFDIPSPHIGLNDLLDIGIGIGANQKGGSAVAHPGVLRQAVAKGGDPDEAKVVGLARRSPPQRAEYFDFEIVHFPRGESPDALPRHRVVLAEFFGCGSAFPIDELAPPSARGGLRQIV